METHRNRIVVFSLFSAVLLFLTFSQANADPVESRDKISHPSSDKNMQAHWDYMGIEGPEHWGMLTEKYMTCETGDRQSPINISTAKHGQHHSTLVFRYHPSHIHEMNNGHTIQVSHTSGCEAELNDRIYKLRQFHYHAPSEHHIEGKSFPMEMHLVHQDEKGHVLVVAVMMETALREPVLKKLWRWLPQQMGKEVSLPLELSITDILPTNTHHYSYLGSLTTPPCTEGVKWIVLKEPMPIAKVDVDNFIEIIGHNARPIQPIGDRQIEEE